MDPNKFVRKWGGALAHGDMASPTPRAQELTAEAKEFLEQRLINDDGPGKPCGFDLKALEQDLGLENGTLQPLFVGMRTWANGDAGRVQSSLLVAFILGMWAMENKYQHLETKTLVTS